ncbi:MarR family transcriptional regulator [Prosthecomicrobium hirschii]|uniref:MarR family winged helix-turn-helix transcriptional regulator n=1 Tax=Prosthecodimorpha hirschii TaxID=665126 RepID=UPI00112BE52D|nr:MarR family transcriptional regulator [Prosthecomicrobium hirschii]TPQ49679.1 MarR family transcriptional regulator [Prosthecomicrobium hirschii]
MAARPRRAKSETGSASAAEAWPEAAPAASVVGVPADGSGPAPTAASDGRPVGTPHDELRVWLRLLGASNRIESILSSRITKEFGISLARFDLLAQLERAPDGLTMTDASRRMMVTNGAITSLVDRLVEEGFVTRETRAEDRRTTVIRLTAEGRARFLAMAASHEEWVVGLIGGLEPQARNELSRGLSALRRHLDALGA